MVASARPAAGAPRPYHFPAFERRDLGSGSKLIVCRVPKLPLATLLVVFDSGSTRDPLLLEGTARMTAKMLVEGTERRTGRELAELLETLGTSLEIGADWDSSVARVTFLSEHLDQVIALVAEVILGPTFPERELQRLKSERMADLLQIESEPRTLADEAFESFLYSSNSRFAVPNGGSRLSVPRITLEHVSDYFARSYVPAGTTFIVAGDVNADDVEKKLRKTFSNWKTRSEKLPVRANALAFGSKRARMVEKADAPQSELRVGHNGLPRNHPDYFAVVVMNAILGGLFGSRINLNLREAHGYTYGASSYFDWRKDAGPFVISTAVATEVTAAALSEINSELTRMRGSLVSQSELSLAKDYLDGVFPIRYETTASIAAALANLVVHELEPDFYDTYRAQIQAVTAEQVLAAANSYLKPEMMQTLIVGNVAVVRESLSALELGPIDQVSD